MIVMHPHGLAMRVAFVNYFLNFVLWLDPLKKLDIVKYLLLNTYGYLFLYVLIVERLFHSSCFGKGDWEKFRILVDICAFWLSRRLFCYHLSVSVVLPVLEEVFNC